MTPVWNSWNPATCMPDNCFCEMIRRSAWIRQPSNSYSSLVFVLMAILVVYFTYKQVKDKNLLARTPVYGWVFALALFATGVTSFFYHASLSFIGQWLDVTSMYLSITFIILYNLERMKSFGPKAFASLYLLSNGILSAVIWYFPVTRRYMFGIMVLAAVVIAIWVQKKIRTKIKSSFFIASVVSVALGFFIWNLDIRGVWCWPSSLIQGHAIWHILTGVSALCIYLFYLSEEEKHA